MTRRPARPLGGSGSSVEALMSRRKSVATALGWPVRGARALVQQTAERVELGARQLPEELRDRDAAAAGLAAALSDPRARLDQPPELLGAERPSAERTLARLRRELEARRVE